MLDLSLFNQSPKRDLKASEYTLDLILTVNYLLPLHSLRTSENKREGYPLGDISIGLP